VKNANYTTKSNGSSQFGFRFVVIAGPLAGQGVWKNLNVPNPEKATDQQKFGRQVSIFLRELNELGVDQTLAATDPDAAAKQVIGRQFRIEVKRTRPKSNGGFWEDVNIKGAASGAPVAPPVAPPSTAGMPPAQPVTPAWQQQARPV
jgi:hypothetical protein